MVAAFQAAYTASTSPASTSATVIDSLPPIIGMMVSLLSFTREPMAMRFFDNLYLSEQETVNQKILSKCGRGHKASSYKTCVSVDFDLLSQKLVK